MPRFVRPAVLLAGPLGLLAAAADPAGPGGLAVTARSRVDVTEARTAARDDGTPVVTTVVVSRPVDQRREGDPRRCAVLICDMWDDHWCRAAARRCDALAKAAGPVVDAARRRGMTVIHCPSDCMGHYSGHPARRRAQTARRADPPPAKALPDPPLPIDDTDGGCDDVPPAQVRKAWAKQHDAIRIDPDRDYVTDTGKEVFNVLAGRGIETVFVIGVHTNMCVLHRSFAIKQLRRWGVDCLLVRDLTDAMYNPAKRPFVPHDEGTQQVIQHIERHWCPSVESKDLLGK